MIRIASLALALVSGQQGLPPDSAVRALLVPRVAAFPDSGKHGAGIVVGLLDATGTRRIVAVGVDSTRVFEIGSITKVFTTSVLQDMVERGEVRLDDPVAKLLPPSVRMPARNGRQITLLDLATQVSGLPRMLSNFTPRDQANPYADYSVQQMYAFLSGYELTRDVAPNTNTRTSAWGCWAMRWPSGQGPVTRISCGAASSAPSGCAKPRLR